LNNLIEQDHRSIKLRLGPMLGFKRFRRAATTIAGIELKHRTRRLNSNSANFASKTKPRLRFGMQCLARDPRQAPERFLAPISSICTTAASVKLFKPPMRRSSKRLALWQKGGYVLANHGVQHMAYHMAGPP
jgi:DDE domain